MGSYISIGLVYDKLDLEQVKIELENLIAYLITELNNVKSMKVSQDVDGEDWIEYGLLKNYQISYVCGLLAEYFYGQISLTCNFLGLDYTH